MESKAKIIFGGNFIWSMCMSVLPLIFFTACSSQKKVSETQSKNENIEANTVNKPTQKVSETSIQQKPKMVESSPYIR